MSEKEKNFIEAEYFGKVNLQALARDVVLFGQKNIVDVVKSYELSADEFGRIIELPAFKKELREIRALTESSPNALIQLKARQLVDDGMMALNDIIHKGEKDSDRIKALEFLAKIGGMMGGGGRTDDDSGKPQASGLVLNVQLGPNGLIPAMPSERRPLRTVRQIGEVIDVQPNK